MVTPTSQCWGEDCIEGLWYRNLVQSGSLSGSTPWHWWARRLLGLLLGQLALSSPMEYATETLRFEAWTSLWPSYLVPTSSFLTSSHPPPSCITEVGRLERILLPRVPSLWVLRTEVGPAKWQGETYLISSTQTMQGCYSTVSLRNVFRIKKYTSDLVKMKIHIHYNPEPHSSESALTNLLPMCHRISTQRQEEA